MKRPVLALAAVALAVRVLWLVHHGAGEITWDGAEYARVAMNLVSGHGYSGLRGGPMFVFPPLYSLTIVALLPIVRNAETAGLIVSLVSGAALVFPMHALASRMYGRSAGLVAATVTAVFPFAVQLSTVVLADMLYLLLVTSGLALLVRTIEDVRLWSAVAASFAFGLAYLTRPEGILFAAFAVVAIAVAAALQPGRRARLPVFVLAPVLTFAILAGPYVAFLSTHAGHLRFEGKSALNLDIGLRMQQGMSYTVAADAVDRRLQEVGPELQPDYYFEPRDRKFPPFAAILRFAAENTRRHLGEIAHVAASRTCGTVLFAALAAIGLFGGLWTRKRRIEETIAVCYGLLVIVSLASVYHFWERYFVGFVPIYVLWGAHGITLVRDVLDRARVHRALRTAVLPALALLLTACAFSTRFGFTDDSATTAERSAGRWLAAHGAAGDRVGSISDQAVYYGDAVWSMLPWAPDAATALGYTKKIAPAYLVLDREYAGERPYVISWLRSGVPFPAARVVFSIGNPALPDLTIVRLAPAVRRRT